MRSVLFLAIGVALLLSGCGVGSGLPQAGDTVKPGLTRKIDWQAGDKAELWVDLQATGAEGKSRRLAFSASPKNNPLATVQFYDAEGQALSPVNIELKERC